MEWIRVEDRLPETKGNYIVHFDDGEVTSFDWLDMDKQRGWWGYDNGARVTHWMPLPPPPKDTP